MTTAAEARPMTQAPAPPDELPVTVIEPRSAWAVVNLRELWRFRELLYCLTGAGVLLVLMGCNGVWPGWSFLWVPVLMLLLLTAALGVGTLLAALTVAYRDFRFVVPFLVQLWMFATPSIYMRADQVVGERWLWLLPLNPAYGLIVNFRQAVLGGPMDLYALAVSGAV